VTGGGSIGGSGSSDGRFTIDAHGTVPPIGNVAYSDVAGGVDFHSTTIASVTCNGSQGKIIGTGKNGSNDSSFTVDVVDNGSSGTSDTFSITLTSPTGYSRNGMLTRGNVTVH